MGGWIPGILLYFWLVCSRGFHCFGDIFFCPCVNTFSGGVHIWVIIHDSKTEVAFHTLSKDYQARVHELRVHELRVHELECTSA